MLIVLIILLVLINLLLWSDVFYKQFFKRFYDIVLSGMAILVLSPILLILTILGAIEMKGNPFFTQKRPGKNARVFKLIKFRSMTCEKGDDGELLPDEKRLTRYGRILRSTSLDELPELINIFKGDMSIVGPRPLLVEYLPWYSEEQSHRHDIRPGLTGYAQAHGRNAIDWDEKLSLDYHYCNHISLFNDILIIFDTAKSVLKREGINSATATTMESFIDYCIANGRKPQQKGSI